ncbi:Kinesin-13A [Hibiscus syriacus]|uniref:Kinesin-13A n=1 Tax=Hibiscus syriacus TaxID=106335 RepID=A0A6A3CAX5_HIBSY|nr:Kinesin-13A [Hibiscus syriacus]
MHRSNAAATALYDHSGGEPLCNGDSASGSGDADDAVMALWSRSAGLRQLASPSASTDIDESLLSNLLMQHVNSEPFKSSPFMPDVNKEFGNESSTSQQQKEQGDADALCSANEKDISLRENNVAKIKVVVRKRPLNKEEISRKEDDIVTVRENVLTVHEPKLKVDLTAYVEKHDFCFDAVLDEHATNDEVYRETVEPIIPIIFQRTKATCFSYGQTEGKLIKATCILDSMRLIMREDGKQCVCIVGLQEFEVSDVQIVKEYIERGNAARSTGSTGANEESSRSHAILQLVIKKHSKAKVSKRNNDRKESKAGKVVGKISFIDLAGSERGADTTDSDRQTRIEGAEINKSLLALKECIRALDNEKLHIPFRGSKLTEVLRDSFVGHSRTVMISCISPNAGSCEHTLNTLRYADRVKSLSKSGNLKRDPAVISSPPSNKESSSFSATSDVDDVYEQTQEVKVVDTGRRITEKDACTFDFSKQPSSFSSSRFLGGREKNGTGSGPTDRERVEGSNNSYGGSACQRTCSLSSQNSIDIEEKVHKVSPPCRKVTREENSEKMEENWAKTDGGESDMSATKSRQANDVNYISSSNVGHRQCYPEPPTDGNIKAILDEKEALIVAHRKEIEDTMEIVRDESNLALSGRQSGEPSSSPRQVPASTERGGDTESEESSSLTHCRFHCRIRHSNKFSYTNLLGSGSLMHGSCFRGLQDGTRQLKKSLVVHAGVDVACSHVSGVFSGNEADSVFIGCLGFLMDWRKLFSCSAGNQLRYFPPNLCDGTPTVHPPSEVFEDGIAEWRLSLVGHFLGPSPKFSALQQIVQNLWKKTLTGCFGADKLRRIWEPNMSKLDFDLSKIPLWVHLYNVPLELFSNEGLSYIASAIGFPLSMDSVTASKSRLKFAKVCIEIGANDTIPRYIDVILNNGQTTKIVVEVPWIPPCCKNCNVFGHSTKGCNQIPSSSQAASLVWRRKEYVISASLDPEVNTVDIQNLTSSELVQLVVIPSKDNEGGLVLGSDSHNQVTDMVVSSNLNLPTDSSLAAIDPGTAPELREEVNIKPSKFHKETVSSSNSPKQAKRGRGRPPLAKKGFTGSSNRFELLSSIDEVQPSFENQVKKTRASASGVAELIKDLKLKKKSHLDKRKSSTDVPYIITAIYGGNNGIFRRHLWYDLSHIESNFSNLPWILGGDFNVILHNYESSDNELTGNPMKILFTKLKRLKTSLKLLNNDCFSDIIARVIQKRDEFELQQLHTLNGDKPLEKELELQRDFILLEEVESMFLKQKAKVHWIKEGTQDPNTRVCPPSILKDLVHPISSLEDKEMLAKEVTNEEIKKAIFSQGNDKALGPDGIIAPNQSAFVKGRSIVYNTLLAQEIVKGYGRKSLSPRCALKIDLQKAFDSINWDFISAVLNSMEFPSKVIDWIIACYSNARYSIAFNGTLIGYFNGAKGIRQGGPISPILFVLIMNVLSNLLNTAASKGMFSFHPKCKNIGLTHLSFADDLLIFCKGKLEFVLGVITVLDCFYEFSVLKLNAGKYELFTAGMSHHIIESIISFTGFKQGRLLVRYLGVSLVTKKLTEKDCQALIDNIKNRIHQWSSKNISYAGRVELIKTVLYSVANYWCRQLVLSPSIIKKIEQLFSDSFGRAQIQKL